MDIEHFGGLSWFAGSGESHVQDGEALTRAAMSFHIARLRSAPSDPAMAFESSCDGRRRFADRRKSAAASLPDETADAPNRKVAPPVGRAHRRRAPMPSAAN